MTYRTPHLIHFLIVLLLASFSASAEPYSRTWDQTAPATTISSSSYTLGWDNTSVEPHLPSPEPVALVEVPVAINLRALPSLIAANQAPSLTKPNTPHPLSRGRARLHGPSDVTVPQHDVTLHAERYYDYGTDAYRLVSKVEVATYRSGGSRAYPKTDVYENFAGYSTFDVVLKGLKAGDRYEVRITWDDGRYRLIERAIDRYPDHVLRVSQPS